MSDDAGLAKINLLGALPYFRHAVSEAKKLGPVQLGIIAVLPDGTKKLEISFDCEEFFKDLAIVLGAGPQTEEETVKADALKFVQIHNITSGEAHE